MTPEDWRPATPEEHLFAERFFALTGHQPFQWQWRLFEHFGRASGPVRSICRNIALLECLGGVDKLPIVQLEAIEKEGPLWMVKKTVRVERIPTARNDNAEGWADLISEPAPPFIRRWRPCHDRNDARTRTRPP